MTDRKKERKKKGKNERKKAKNNREMRPTGQRCILIVSLRGVRHSKHVYQSFDSLQELTVAKNN